MKISRFQFNYLIVLLFTGVIYVSQYWSPSSYGIVLNKIGVNDEKPLFGRPRPIRSDEWAVVTPLTQATVNNHFERTNKTSLYEEDLRINYGLPIFDWGIIFKPTMWAYLIMDPAHAYSFHWFAVFALFITGHALLFSKFGLTQIQSILLSINLYFTGFTQFWWNEKGPIFAFFPWIIWILLTNYSSPIRLAIFYWLGSSWLITNFYPPIFISLAFVGTLIILVLGDEWFKPKKLTLLIATTIFSSLTVVIYLKDYLLKTATTLYPGHRNVGGGSVPWQEWWSQFFPFATFDWHFESVVGQNICEVGVVGSAFILMTICCLDFKQAFSLLLERNEHRKSLLILGGGLLLMTAWMLLPLPSWSGIPLLWNNVQPERMEYAAGLLLVLIVAIFGSKACVKFTYTRLFIYIFLVFIGWVVIKGISFDSKINFVLDRSNDLLVVLILMFSLIYLQKEKYPQFTALLSISIICGSLMLSWFNPIQPAKKFFTQQNTAYIRALTNEVQSPHGILAVPGMPGATLNGLGFKSVSHVTAVPALDFWRKIYPNMPEKEFLDIFNRYAHISLTSENFPRAIQPDLIGVPLSEFWQDYVEIPINTNQSITTFWLTEDRNISGEIALDRLAKIDTLDLLIGTGRNNADGILTLRLCNSTYCVSSSRNLTDTLDNAYIHFKLDKTLIVDSSLKISYSLQLENSVHPVALWTYAESVSPNITLISDGKVQSLTPRFRVKYISN